MKLKNANSLCINNGVGPWQTCLATMDQMWRNPSSDVLCTLELQRNMNLVDKSLQYEELFGIGKDKVGMAGWNKHCKIFSQPGGQERLLLEHYQPMQGPGRTSLVSAGLSGSSLRVYNSHKFRFVTGHWPCGNRTKTQGKKEIDTRCGISIIVTTAEITANINP